MNASVEPQVIGESNMSKKPILLNNMLDKVYEMKMNMVEL